MVLPEVIRIVSRDSPMALAQVERARAELAAAYPGTATEVVPVRTTGDRWLGDLSLVEGKGAFTKEVDAALLAGAADLAVHCVKDIPGDRPLAAGTVFAGFLARDDIRDALVDPAGRTLDQLPPGTRIGTSSVRRTAQLALPTRIWNAYRYAATPIGAWPAWPRVTPTPCCWRWPAWSGSAAPTPSARSSIRT